jgi:hypothetical protein
MVGLIQLLRSMGRIEPNAGVQALIGRRPRTFRQWVEANIGAFRSPLAAVTVAALSGQQASQPRLAAESRDPGSERRLRPPA